MSKLAVVAAVALAIVLLASPRVVGSITEARVRDRVAAIDASSAAAAQVTAFERGWLRSSAKIELSLAPDGVAAVPMAMIPIPLVVEFAHGPVAMLDGVHFGWSKMVARLAPGAPGVAELQQTLGVPYVFEFRGRTGFGGALSIQVKMDNAWRYFVVVGGSYDKQQQRRDPGRQRGVCGRGHELRSLLVGDVPQQRPGRRAAGEPRGVGRDGHDVHVLPRYAGFHDDAVDASPDAHGQHGDDGVQLHVRHVPRGDGGERLRDDAARDDGPYEPRGQRDRRGVHDDAADRDAVGGGYVHAGDRQLHEHVLPQRRQQREERRGDPEQLDLVERGGPVVHGMPRVPAVVRDVGGPSSSTC